MAGTALITGYSGFLGRHLVERLRPAGWRLLLAGRAPVAEDTQTRFLPVDLDRPETVMALAGGETADVVVHLACRVALGKETDAELYRPNVLSTGAFAALAAGWNAKLVFASTVIVHGARTSRIDSASPLDPDTAYARSKLLGEHLIAASGAEAAILRLGGLFGAAGPAHLGLNRSITAALEGKRPLLVGGGAARRNYLFVKDAAEAVAQAMEGDVSGTHLVAGSETLSVADMIGQLCDVLLPGTSPEWAEGGEAADQIITPSPALRPSRSFRAALEDIAAGAR